MKRTLCICMAWLGLGLAVQAQTATLTTQPASIAQGREAVLDVTLAGGVAISGGQFTVTLPQGITIKDVTLNEERSTHHTLEYRLEGSNSAKILFYAQPTAPLKGNEGTLCTLSLEATSDMASGEYEVSFSNVRLAVDATTTAEVNAVEGTLKVIPCYTIKVEATEGGSVEGGGIFVEGDRVTLKAIPDEGYHFEQWSDGSTDTPYTFEAKEHVTLTAKFAPNAYNLIYVIDGVEYKRVSVLYKSEVEGIAVEAREGHTFSGWNGLPATMPARDVTVNGSFTVNKYLVTFKIGDVVVSSKSLAYGTAIVAPSAPEKEGYTFDGWGEVAETVPARDVTYEGSYSVNSYLLTFVVDGETVQSESVAYGTVITMPKAPVKEGHTFSGWSEMPETMPAKDVTISGTFAINSYTVTYVVDGEVYKTESLAYGSKLTAIALPVKEGHTFSGWSEMPETMPAKDITVSGRFTVNSYTVTFVLEGDVLAEYTLQYGSAIEVPKVPIKEGLSFSGWGKVLETMPARDLIYEGSYMNNAYTIIYMVDGVEYCRVMVEYGDVIELVASPVQEGYTFSGWSEVPETMPAEDVIISGTFAINSYTVTYQVDGEVYKTESLAYGSKLTAIASPVKEGYTFSGWSEMPETMPAGDVTVNGSFIINNYVVTFKIGDTVVSSKSLEYGTAIVAPDAPEKEGYTFAGWGEVAETVPAHDVTYEGGYSVNSYLLTFVVDGETVQSESVAYGTAITMPEAPVQEGYTFSGWSEVPETMPAEDVIISGTFAINSYTVTYVVDGEVYKTESLAYGSKLTAIASPVKEGHTFSGWSEVPETMPAGDVTVNGSFIINNYVVTFKIGDTVVSSKSLEYGTAIVAPDAPEKEGHTFAGWGEVAETVPAHDVTYEGGYSVNSYLLTFVVDGETVQSESVAYGTAITMPEAPVKEGHTFSGWVGLPATMPANDVTVSGTFTINKYLVTFKIGDEVIYSESLEYGSTIVIPEAPEKEGYTFDGWGEVAKTVPARDVTYEGSYSVNSYKLTYMVDGEKYREEMVAYGTMLTAIDAPEKEGHTFSGWSGLPTTMPANDVTVSGTFTINTYTVTFYDWDGTVLKRQTVVHGQDATPPADPTREGYTFTGWDFSFTNVVWDLAVHAVYVKNAETGYTVEYHAGANGWIDGADWHAHDLRVAGFSSPLYRAQGKVEKLRFTVNRTKGYTKYFCLSELEFYDANGNKIELTASSFKSNADHNTLNPNSPDGGSFGALVDGQIATYFHSAWQNMPAEDHWIEVTLPNGGYDTFWFRMLSRAYSTENGVINDQSHTFPGEMVMTTPVALVEIEQPDAPELDNASLYHVTLPYRDNVSWAIAQGGQVLSINTMLGLANDGEDSRQQFAFISNDGGTTHYLYHPAECKYVNKDGSLSTTAKDAVYFKRGVYPGTFVVYFDNAHFINTNEKNGLIINDWGPGGRMGTADGGNSCKITPVGRFDITNIDFLSGEDTGRVQKVFENGEMFILLPDGSKYTTTGVRVK